MSTINLKEILKNTDKYNLHTHTQFCDGRNTMGELAEAAKAAGFKYLGFTPHSPVCVQSPCNMTDDSLPLYFFETDRLAREYEGRMKIFRGMEIDYLSPDFGPHIDYFQKMELDYRLGSVHFVVTKDKRFIDCDGYGERFLKNLHDYFGDDIRYVAETYLESVLKMIELGGFDILGHFDKIAGNAGLASPKIEDEVWYQNLIEEIIRNAGAKELGIEINTKAFLEKGRFFPAERWWPKLLSSGVPLLINSDAHYRDRINNGRAAALERLREIEKKRKRELGR